MKTIEDVAKFLGVSPKNKIKTLALMAESLDAKTGKASARAVVLLMRGDHQMNEAKLSSARRRQRNTSHAGRRNPAALQFSGGISGARRHRVGEGHEGCRTSGAAGGQSARRPHQSDRRSEQGGLSPEEHHAGPRLPAYGLRRSAQRDRGRRMSQLRRSHCASTPRSRSATSSNWATSIRNPWARAFWTRMAKKSRPSWAAMASESSAS